MSDMKDVKLIENLFDSLP